MTTAALSGVIASGKAAAGSLAAYVAAVMADSPAGFWLLNDTGSTAEDQTVNNRDGTITGTHSSDGPIADGGGSIQLNGTTDNVSIADHNDWSSASSTVEFWFRCTVAPTGVYLMSHRHNSSTAQEWDVFQAVTTGKLTRTWQNTSQGIWRSATTTPGVTDTTTWHHFVGTYDGSTGPVAMYLDGASVAFTQTGPAGSKAGNAAVPLVIGARSGASVGFTGRMFGAAYYTTVLSAARVAAHYAAATT